MTTVHRNNSTKRQRFGLTLMELVVVLTILVALGGILAGMFPTILTKAHDSVTVTNITEVDKAIQGYMATDLSYPNYFDSILSGSNIYSRAVFSPTGSYSAQYGNQATFNGANVFQVHALTGFEPSSLTSANITSLMAMQDPPSADGATFGAYLGPPVNANTGAVNTTNVVPVATGTNVIMVTDANYIRSVMNIPPPSTAAFGGATPIYGTDYIYVVFGLGPYCTIVGDTAYGMVDAPVSFGEHQYEQPQNAYARMLCAFRVYTSIQRRCEFVGAAHPDPTGFGSAAMHTEEFYQTQ